MAKVSTLDISLYDSPIGTLTHVGGDRNIFAFNDSYIENSDRPVLGLGFKDQFGDLITGFRPTQTRVMPFFSNLLPEEHMRRYLADRAGVSPVREFYLLWVLGMDLPGAITIRPAEGEAWPVGAEEASADKGRDEAYYRENALRFSLAGVQLKFSAINEASGGLTIPAKGIGGSWIVKLPSRQFEGVPENEYAMMTLARLVGIDVPAIELVDVNSLKNLPQGIDSIGGKALAIERFDRLADGTPVHIEDFAQVFNVYPEQKYDKASMRNIARVLSVEAGEQSITEFIRRLTFNTLIGNADMHLKNWSLMYPDKRTPKLAPAYDFVSTVPYINSDSAALKVSRSKRFDAFTKDELAHLASKAMLPEQFVLDIVEETVELFYQNWQSYKSELPLSEDIRNAIEHHLQRVPIATERS